MNEQIERLASYIMAEVNGEPSQSEGAGDCAIRIIRNLQSINTELLEALQDAYDMLTYAEEITGPKAHKFVKTRQQAYRAIAKTKGE